MLGGVPLKWIDPATWPWFVYLWIVVIFSSWLKPAWRWLQRQRSANWPIAEGHIESVAVTELKVFSIRSRSSPFGAELGYSYSIAGSPQAGWYSRDFPTEQEAAAFLRDLKGKSIAESATIPTSRPCLNCQSLALICCCETVVRYSTPKLSTRCEHAGDCFPQTSVSMGSHVDCGPSGSSSASGSTSEQ